MLRPLAALTVLVLLPATLPAADRTFTFVAPKNRASDPFRLATYQQAVTVHLRLTRSDESTAPVMAAVHYQRQGEESASWKRMYGTNLRFVTADSPGAIWVSFFGVGEARLLQLEVTGTVASTASGLPVASAPTSAGGAPATGGEAATANAVTRSHKPADRVHVLMVIDSAADDIRTSVLADQGNLERALQDGLGGYRYDLVILSGRRATRENVLRHYRALSVGPDDTLVFLYCGHGALFGTEHVFTPEASKIPRREVRQAMQALKPGLVVLVTDCCANRVRTSRLEEQEDPTTVDRPGRGISQLSALLLYHRGVVDINSCLMGRSAACSRLGGHFTRVFVRSVCDPVLEGSGRFLTWGALFERIKDDGRRLRPSVVPHTFARLN